jgi:hypothetical protein
MSIASSSPSWKTNFFPIDERDIHLQRLMIPDLLSMNGLSTTRIGMYDAPYESYVRRSRWRIVATNLFFLSVCFMRKDTMAVFVIVWPAWQDIDSSLCSAYMYGMANAWDTLGDSVLLLRFVLDHVLFLGCSPILVRCFRIVHQFRCFSTCILLTFEQSQVTCGSSGLAGVRGERLFVDKRYKKGKANNQIQNNLSNLSKPMIQHGSERFKVTRPVSQFGPRIVCSSHANTSQGKYRDRGWPICTWAHVAIVTLYNATTRRDENVL